jgi:hypothetical protein
MRKNIFSKHPIAWGRLISANVTLIAKDQHQEKSKQRIFVGYGAIINHFGNITPYMKDDVGQK